MTGVQKSRTTHALLHAITDATLNSEIRREKLARTMKLALQVPFEKKEALVMFLLAVQFGLQPVLTKRFISSSICKSSVILCQEGLKFGLSFLMFHIDDEEKKGLDGM